MHDSLTPRQQAKSFFLAGQEYLQQRAYPEAIEAFSKAIDILPDQPDYYFYRSISLYNAAYQGLPCGSFEKAQADYDKTQSLAINKAKYDFSRYIFYLIRS